MSYEFWYMFPVAVLVSTVAISSGVSGATFFTPIFLLGLGLPLRAAIAAGLTTATFGFASGLAGYARRGLIDYRLGARLMASSIPAALLGVWLAGQVDTNRLRLVLGAALLLIAASFWKADSAAPPIGTTEPARPPVSLLEGALFTGVGGLLLGMISAGLGELNAYFLMKRSRLPSGPAIATSVLVLAGTVFAAALGHLVGLLEMDPDVRSTVTSLVTFTIPGVVVGAQIGCAIGSRAPQRIVLRVLGILFAIVALAITAPVLGWM